MGKFTIKTGRSQTEAIKFEWPNHPPDTRGVLFGRAIATVVNAIAPRITEAEIIAAVVQEREKLHDKIEFNRDHASSLVKIKQSSVTFVQLEQAIFNEEGSTSLSRQAGRTVAHIAETTKQLQARVDAFEASSVNLDFNELSRLLRWLESGSIEIQGPEFREACDEPPPSYNECVYASTRGHAATPRPEYAPAPAVTLRANSARFHANNAATPRGSVTATNISGLQKRGRTIDELSDRAALMASQVRQTNELLSEVVRQRRRQICVIS